MTPTETLIAEVLESDDSKWYFDDVTSEAHEDLCLRAAPLLAKMLKKAIEANKNLEEKWVCPSCRANIYGKCVNAKLDAIAREGTEPERSEEDK